MSRYPALSEYAEQHGLTAEQVVAQAKASKPKPALTASQALAAADRALANHTYAAVFGDDGSSSGTAAPAAAAADGLAYEHVWPLR